MNDTYGHECGDLAIKITAGAILRYRPDDALAVRMGGDEFLYYVDGITRQEEAEEKARKAAKNAKNRQKKKNRR